MTEPSREFQEHYRTTWRLMLRHVVGWPDDRAEQWLREREDLLTSPFLTHEHEAWYLVHRLVPESLRRRLPDRQRVELEVRVVAALSDWEGDPERVDWERCRSEVQAIVREYERAFPE